MNTRNELLKMLTVYPDSNFDQQCASVCAGPVADVFLQMQQQILDLAVQVADLRGNLRDLNQEQQNDATVVHQSIKKLEDRWNTWISSSTVGTKTGDDGTLLTMGDVVLLLKTLRETS